MIISYMNESDGEENSVSTVAEFIRNNLVGQKIENMYAFIFTEDIDHCIFIFNCNESIAKKRAMAIKYLEDEELFFITEYIDEEEVTLNDKYNKFRSRFNLKEIF